MNLRIKREELKRELSVYKEIEKLRSKFKTQKGFDYVLDGKKSIEKEIDRISNYLGRD